VKRSNYFPLFSPGRCDKIPIKINWMHTKTPFTPVSQVELYCAGLVSIGWVSTIVWKGSEMQVKFMSNKTCIIHILCYSVIPSWVSFSQNVFRRHKKKRALVMVYFGRQ
jgi:hypothetical protein